MRRCEDLYRKKESAGQRDVDDGCLTVSLNPERIFEDSVCTGGVRPVVVRFLLRFDIILVLFLQICFYVV